MPWVKCDTCSENFYKLPFQIKEHNFCSKGCRLKWFGSLNPPRVTINCTYCGKEFGRQRSKLWYTGNNFCSRECQSQWHSKQMQLNNPFKRRWQQMSEQERIEYGNNMRQRNLGRRHSDEINKKKGLPGKLNPFYGKQHSVEFRQYMSEFMTKRMSDPVERQRILDAIFRSNQRKPNKAELKLQDILDRYFPSDWKYTGNGYHTIGGFPPDFTNCNGQKALIELFGYYWHTRNGIRWHYTELGRIMAYNSLGYRCLVIWERELKDEQAVVAKVKQFMRRKK